MPTRGTNLPTEIACYSLPYGGLGFASHLLTYYTIICLGFGRKPLWPFKRVKNGKYGLALAVIGLVGGFILSTITMVRCRNHWQLLVLAVWKFSMSLFNGIVAVHVAANHFWNARGRVESEARGREEKQSWLQNEDVNNPQPNLKVFLWFAICCHLFFICVDDILTIVMSRCSGDDCWLRWVDFSHNGKLVRWIAKAAYCGTRIRLSGRDRRVPDPRRYLWVVARSMQRGCPKSAGGIVARISDTLCGFRGLGTGCNG